LNGSYNFSNKNNIIINDNNKKEISNNNISITQVISVEDVVKWLQSISIPNSVTKNFSDNEIDFKALKTLTKEELIDE
jgi:hypothetical protein